LALATVTVLSIIPTERGTLTENWMTFLWFGLGWGMYLMPLVLGAVGIGLVLEVLGRDLEIHWGKSLALIVSYLLFLTLLGLTSSSEPVYGTSWDYVDAGPGGKLGTLLSFQLSSGVGVVGAYVVVFLLVAVCLTVLIELSPVEIAAAVAGAWRSLQDWYRIRFRLSANNGLVNSLADPRVSQGSGSSPTSSASGDASPLVPASSTAGTSVSAVSGILDEVALQPRIAGGGDSGPPWELPVLTEIFETSTEHEISQTEIRTRVRIIEDTLSSFGVPARVTEVNQGPAVTQFGVEPGFFEQKLSSGRIKRSKVKVSKISSLSSDLALALAASPVRIEAPVPGRNIVGIEVPNMETSLVTLRSVMETESFQKVRSNLTIALGQDVSGQPAVADLTAMPHLLIAGATGSGKSVCINAIVAGLLCQNTPDDLRFIMIDPKMVELSGYNGIPHLLDRVIVELERVVDVLKWATQEMDRRYKSFSKAGVRNLESFNAVAPVRGESSLPQIVIVIDELADLMMVAPDAVERHVCRIAQMARATGIHLVIATQRPSVDVITGLIKANFPARVAFAVSSQVDSRVILDTVGAERLLGHGDMLFMRPDSSKLARLQGCFVSDAEINRLVRYWRSFRFMDKDVPIEDVSQAMVQQPLLEDMILRDQAASEEDPLLNEAVEVVLEHDRASISLLQRKLRVGYTRAARLIDILEERSVIGPDRGGGRSREVLDKGTAPSSTPTPED
jgi:S-DNA-T family DNA segregation ATPase FtsK/SpoIIIE